MKKRRNLFWFMVDPYPEKPEDNFVVRQAKDIGGCLTTIAICLVMLTVALGIWSAFGAP